MDRPLMAVVDGLSARSRGRNVAEGQGLGVADRLTCFGGPMGADALHEVWEVAPRIPCVGRLQPDLPATVGPPDLEVRNRAFRLLERRPSRAARVRL